MTSVLFVTSILSKMPFLLSARDRQVGTSQVALLPLETMGVGRLPGTAEAWRIFPRSVERQQVSSRPMAVIKDTGIGVCATIAVLH